MSLLNIRNLHKSFGNKALFEETNLTINPLERIGIVGVNGSGKTTLLRMIAGQETPDDGAIEINNQVRVEYLAQNPDMDDSLTVLNYLFQGQSPTVQLLRNYETAVLNLSQHPHDENYQAQLASLNQRMDQENGWAAEAQAKGVLSRLGLDDFTAKIGPLSGGQRRRVAMARVLIDPADLLILDEPTNHIDPDTIVWLEDFLANLKTGLLLVTHDRYFLDRVVDHIIEIENGTIHKHSGNYSRYLENKVAREAQNQKLATDQRKLLQREIAWVNRTPMARGGKQKARIQRAENLQDQLVNTNTKQVDINVATKRTGKQIMEIKGLSKSFGDQTVVKDFSYVVNHRARLGIVGPNGTGKSTLLNMIAGRLEPDAGEIDIGTTVKIGYYDQESLALDESQRLIDYISDIAEVIYTAKGDKITASQMLDRFLFSNAMQYEYISTLSGGERRRLYLLQTLMMAPNFLLLDEPTNDLDIQTLTILEDFLDSFDGVLITVSHDRYFLDRTVEHIFAFEGNGEIKQYPGNFSAYQQRQQTLAKEKPQTEATQTPQSARSKSQPTSSRPRKLTFNEQRELAGLEEKIVTMETSKETLAEQINAIGDDYQRLQALSTELETLDQALEAAIERWAVLSEIAETT